MEAGRRGRETQRRKRKGSWMVLHVALLHSPHFVSDWLESYTTLLLSIPDILILKGFSPLVEMLYWCPMKRYRIKSYYWSLEYSHEWHCQNLSQRQILIWRLVRGVQGWPLGRAKCSPNKRVEEPRNDVGQPTHLVTSVDRQPSWVPTVLGSPVSLSSFLSNPVPVLFLSYLDFTSLS